MYDGLSLFSAKFRSLEFHASLCSNTCYIIITYYNTYNIVITHDNTYNIMIMY